MTKYPQIDATPSRTPAQALLAVLVLTTLAACAPTATSEPPSADVGLSEQFRWVAFRTDQGEPHSLHRWQGSIDVTTVGASATERREVERHLDLLADLTARPVSVTHLTSAPIPRSLPRRVDGMRIVFGDAGEIFPLGQILFGGIDNPLHFNCGAVTYGRNGAIVGALIAIRNDIAPTDAVAPYSDGCIAQEMTQSLGMYGDLDRRSDTIFSSLSRVATLTEQDRGIVRRFYDPRLQPGMTENEAMSLLTRQ